jgi:drug/metabolite transporter (DMT)-like permease
MERHTLVGRGAAVSAVGLLSFGPSIVKMSDLDEMTFILWRLLLAAVVYGAVLLATRRPFGLDELRRSVPGGVVFALNLVFFFTAMRRTSAANAVVIGALQPVVLLGLAGRMFGERPRRALYGWSAVSIFGVALAMYASDGGGVATRSGDLLAFIGMLLFCAYYVVSKRTRAELDTVTYQLGLTLVASVTILPVALVMGHGISPPSGGDWWPVVLMAVLPGSGHLLINYAHAHVSLAVMGLINLLFTVVAPLYAWWLVDERIGGLQAVGMAVVVAALAAVVTRPVEASAS